MRRRRWLILSVVTLLVIGAGVAITRTSRFQKWYNPPVLVLPQDGDVVEVRASLRDFQGIFTAVPEFRVPTDHVPDILGWLRPADYNRKSRLDRIDELGEVVSARGSGKSFGCGSIGPARTGWCSPATGWISSTAVVGTIVGLRSMAAIPCATLSVGRRRRPGK